MSDLHEEYELTCRGYRRQGIECYIDPSVRIGMGTVVWHYARVLANVDLGLFVSIGGGSEIGVGSTIGAHSRVGANTFLPPRSVVGHNVFIGPGVTCTDDKTPFAHKPDDPPYTPQPPIIEDYASIGAGAILLPGVRVGHHARVAAGAIVTKDVPPHGTVRGEPARPFEMSPTAQIGYAPEPLPAVLT